MAEAKQGWGCFPTLIVILIFATVVSVLRVALGEKTLLDNPIGQALVCLGLILWAYAYYRLQNTDARIIFGVIQIIAATCSN
jgi:hypothetical protein